MTITIYFKDGTERVWTGFKDGTERVWTGVEGYTNDGHVVTFVGTDGAGIEAGWDFNWSDIHAVKKT